jgi:hypothetical protein
LGNFGEITLDKKILSYFPFNRIFREDFSAVEKLHLAVAFSENGKSLFFLKQDGMGVMKQEMADMKRKCFPSPR